MYSRSTTPRSTTVVHSSPDTLRGGVGGCLSPVWPPPGPACARVSLPPLRGRRCKPVAALLSPSTTHTLCLGPVHGHAVPPFYLSTNNTNQPFPLHPLSVRPAGLLRGPTDLTSGCVSGHGGGGEAERPGKKRWRWPRGPAGLALSLFRNVETLRCSVAVSPWPSPLRVRRAPNSPLSSGGRRGV